MYVIQYAPFRFVSFQFEEIARKDFLYFLIKSLLSPFTIEPSIFIRKTLGTLFIIFNYVRWRNNGCLLRDNDNAHDDWVDKIYRFNIFNDMTQKMVFDIVLPLFYLLFFFSGLFFLPQHVDWPRMRYSQGQNTH